MPTCDNCGEVVSHDYHRVNEVDGELPHCIHCTTPKEREETLV